MNDLQSRKQNMAETVKQVMDDNQAIWAANPTIVTGHTLLGNSIVRIDTLATLQGTDITGYAAEKLRLKNELANKTMVVAGPLTAYARINDMEPLLEKVDIVRTDVMAAKDTIAVDICTVVFEEAEAIDPAVLGTVGITPAMLNDMNTAIVAFEASSPVPRAKVTQKETTTSALAVEFEVLDEILVNLDDLHELFKETEIDYYKNYHHARKIVGIGVRRISLIVKCLDAVNGAVVAGAEVSIEELADTLVSTRTGNARFFSLPPGSYTVTITHELYEQVVLEHVGIFDGKTTRFDLELVRV